MKNEVLIVGLLTLFVGLLVGYILSPRTMMGTYGAGFGPGYMYDMHEEMMDHDDEYEDFADGNGLMNHVMDEMMLGLRGKSGEAYEEAFLEMMIAHHLGAIEMAEELLEETDRPELVEMAESIITAQSQEVETMRGWLDEWFNH